MESVSVITANPSFSGVLKYRSLVAWQTAHALAAQSLRITDAAYHPRLIRLAAEVGYLSPDSVAALSPIVDECIATLRGLIRSTTATRG